MRPAILHGLCILIFGFCRVSFAQVVLPSGGEDLGSQINHAVASLPATGGKILIQNPSSGQCYSYVTPIVLSKPVIVEGQGPSTCLQFAGSGIAVSMYGNTQPLLPPGVYGD